MKRATLLLAIGILSSAALAIAQAPPGMRMHHGDADGPAMIEYLALTPSQQTQWQSIHNDLSAAVKPLFIQERAGREQVDAALQQKTDPCAIGNLVVSQHAIGDQIKAAHDAAHQKLAAILTPDQKTKFDAFLAASQSGHMRPGAPLPAPTE